MSATSIRAIQRDLTVVIGLLTLTTSRLSAQGAATPPDTGAPVTPAVIGTPRPANPLIAPPTAFVLTQVADTLLPVFDDVGVLISEESIAAQIRRGRNRQVVAGLLGLLGGALIMGGWGFDQCDLFEQCSDREEFHSASAIWFGGAIGLVFGAGVIAPGLDRWSAVESIRGERRAQRERP
jgi:hypothetical protein